MMWWNHGGLDNAGGWLVMSLMMLIFWCAVIALGVWLVRGTRSRSTIPEPAAATDGSERPLAERFARGEIDESEFTRSRALLSSSPAKETLR
jgi:putative membrane protein